MKNDKQSLSRITLARRTFEDKAAFGYEIIDDASVLNKPTLLILPGANSTNPQRSNGTAKIIQLLAGRFNEYREDIQIVGAIYPGEKSEHLEYIQTYNAHDPSAPRQYRDFVVDFVDSYFLPLISDKSQTAPYGRSRVSIEEAFRRNRNLNIFGHSLGGVMVSEIGGIYADRMRQLGYADGEITLITSQILAVVVGNVGNLGTNKSNITTLSIFNFNDGFIKKLSSNENFYKSLDIQPGFLHLEHVNEHETILVGKIPNSMMRADSKNNLAGSFINAQGKLNDVFIDEDEGHDLRTYLLYGTGANGMMMPAAAALTLINGLDHSFRNHSSTESSKLPSIEELLKPSNTVYQRNSYESAVHSGIFAHPERIAAAINFNDRIRTFSHNKTLMQANFG